MPARLASSYHEALNNPDLLALKDDIALIDARLDELAGQLNASGAAETWEAIKTGLDFCDVAIQSKDVPRLMGHLAAIREVVKQREVDGLRWEEIATWMERKRKLSETERRLLLDMQQVITVERAMVLMAALVDIVRRHVDDRGILTAIVRDVDGLLAANGRP